MAHSYNSRDGEAETRRFLRHSGQPVSSNWSVSGQWETLLKIEWWILPKAWQTGLTSDFQTCRYEWVELSRSLSRGNLVGGASTLLSPMCFLEPGKRASYTLSCSTQAPKTWNSLSLLPFFSFVCSFGLLFSLTPFFLKSETMGWRANEEQLRTLAALEEKQGSGPQIHVGAHTHP